ncbi:hypothetical protein RF55_14747 [Lasius niger]|uniref:Uncharacterized protein n=1 Tax=Lasius niger TaxID=67767 RepID=A0A0J7K730_LASNI|nr:hypothetical protein RF55_14747 [Lasius niger]
MERAELERKEEQERRERRKKNLIWRGIEEENKEERRGEMEWIVGVLGKKGRVENVEEKKGEGGRIVLLVELKEVWDKEELWEKREEVWKRWGVNMDEDLTMEERRYRWKIREKARL